MDQRVSKFQYYPCLMRGKLLIKLACLVKKYTYIFNIKNSLCKIDSTRRSSVLSLDLQFLFPGIAVSDKGHQQLRSPKFCSPFQHLFLITIGHFIKCIFDNVFKWAVPGITFHFVTLLPPIQHDTTQQKHMVFFILDWKLISQI